MISSTGSPIFAPAANGVTVLPFQLALPMGNGGYSASFYIARMTIDGGAVCFGHFRPIFFPFGEALYIVDCVLVLKWFPE